MITFTTLDGRMVHVDHGKLYGDTELIDTIHAMIDDGLPCSCNYWGEIPPSLATDWKAYLTVCGSLTRLYGRHPDVMGVPDNPAGYEPEGVYSAAKI